MKKNDVKTCIQKIVEKNTGMSAHDFLNYKKEYGIDGLKEAQLLLYQAIKKKMFIFIMSDYDVDGVASGCIFETLFRAAHYGNYRIRFPKRFSEGYGIRESVIDEIPEGALLITVDNGIAAVDAIKKAKEKRIKTMILDHHQTMKKNEKIILPDADVIVDPHVTGNCTFNYYCGAGLAYRLCSSFIKKGHPNEKIMVSFAALATIADVMPLVEDNRRIVKEGLHHLTQKNARTTGTYALLKAFNMDSYISESDVEYYIAPAINAMSRMNDNGAELAFRCLIFNGPLREAERLAEEMYQTNQARKNLVACALEQALSLIQKEGRDQYTPMCVYCPGLHEGIIGILAGELATRYQRPVLVLTDSSSHLKGSARSYGNVDLFQLLCECDAHLLNWGGHAEAAGMSCEKKEFSKLQAALCEAFARLGCRIDQEDTGYDLEIDEANLLTVASELDRYRPFGQGNPEIRFLIRKFQLHYKKFADSYTLRLGRKQEHIKFLGRYLDALSFGLAEKYDSYGKPLTLDLIGTIDKSHYIQKKECTLVVKDQIKVIDFYPADIPDNRSEMAKELARLAQLRRNEVHAYELST